MNGAATAGGMPDAGRGIARAPTQLLLWCLFASLALHAAVLLMLPDERHRDVPAVSIPVLDVVMVTQAPEAVRLPQDRPPIPQKVATRAQAMTHAPVQEPAFVATPAAEPAAEPAPAIAAASRPSPVQSRPSPPRAEAPASPPLFNAAYLRNPAPAYPAPARRSGDQGTVMLKVLVSPEGAPVRVELDQSSGSRLLDGAALDAVKGWRFVPARRGERSIEDWVRVPIVFRLDG